MIFLVLSGKMIFLFSENMILHVRRKMKDDLSLKINGNVIFSSNFLKRWSFQKEPHRHMIFLVLSGKMVFYPENMIFFPWTRGERWPFSGNTRKHDALPSEGKQETWYIGLKFGFFLHLFSWRYSTKNNLQYFVPFSPQELCLGACLGADKGNHLSFRG